MVNAAGPWEKLASQKASTYATDESPSIHGLSRAFTLELRSALMAYAWYHSEPLSGFSGQTAMQLVRNERADEVLNYIDAVEAGIHP